MYEVVQYCLHLIWSTSVTVNSSLVDSMKEYTISNEALHSFPHAFYVQSKKPHLPPPPPVLVYQCFHEETRPTALQDKQRHRASTRLAQFKGLWLPGLRNGHNNWTSQVNWFLLLLIKNAGKLHSQLLIFIQIIACSFRSISCYSGAVESENQCMRSVCI